MAEEVREHMAQMGFRTFEEMVGRADMLRVDESALHSKSATLDLGPILTPAASLAPGEPQFNAQVRARVRVRVSPDPNPNPNPKRALTLTLTCSKSRLGLGFGLALTLTLTLTLSEP